MATAFFIAPAVAVAPVTTPANGMIGRPEAATIDNLLITPDGANGAEIFRGATFTLPKDITFNRIAIFAQSFGADQFITVGIYQETDGGEGTMDLVTSFNADVTNAPGGIFIEATVAQASLKAGKYAVMWAANTEMLGASFVAGWSYAMNSFSPLNSTIPAGTHQMTFFHNTSYAVAPPATLNPADETFESGNSPPLSHRFYTV